jgi:RNA polymerase sigma-70 factor (ECF subfamily)
VDDDALALLGPDERVALDVEPERADALREIVSRALAARPELAARASELGAWIARRVPAEELDPAKTRGAELLLCMACAKGDEKAIAAFEAAYFGEVDRAFAKVRPPCDTDEARQLVRHRLFVKKGEEGPSIAGYRGQGELRHFVRITATRRLLNVATRAPHEDELEESIAGAAPPRDADPELAAVRARYAAHFRDAFKEGVRALGERDRALLRYAVCDGLTVDEIGAIYGVHRATAARWVAKAKEHLEEDVRAALRARLTVGDSELESLGRAVQSQIEVSLSSALRA